MNNLDLKKCHHERDKKYLYQKFTFYKKSLKPLIYSQHPLIQTHDHRFNFSHHFHKNPLKPQP